MVAFIGVVASPSQGVSYYQRDGYYAKDDPAHLEASAWAGKGAEALGLAGPVDPDTFQATLEGKVPDDPHFGRRGKDGEIKHRPGRDVTMSAFKSVSLMAMIGGDERIVDAHDRAVRTTLGWVEQNAVLTRMQDGTTGAMVHAAASRWWRRPSGTTLPAISTLNSIHTASSPTWCRARTTGGAPW